MFLVVFREHDNHPCSRQEVKNPTRADEMHRKYAKHRCHRDKIILMTPDIVTAVRVATTFDPFGWRSADLRDLSDMAHILRAVEGKWDPNGQSIIYSRYLQRYGKNVIWKEAWMGSWEKQYQRALRTAERAAKKAKAVAQ